jgi:hypothetical protein
MGVVMDRLSRIYDRFFSITLLLTLLASLVIALGLMLPGIAGAEPASLQDLLLYGDEKIQQQPLTPVHELLGDSEARPGPMSAELAGNATTPSLESAPEAAEKTNTPVIELEPLTLPAPQKPAEKPAPEKAKLDLPPLNPPKDLPEAEAPKNTALPMLEPDTRVEGASPATVTPSSEPVPAEASTPKVEIPPLETPEPVIDDKASQAVPDKEPGKDKKEKTKKPEIVYKPLSGMVVFPVLRHGNEKAFGDVVILFSNEFAGKLETKFPQTRIYNPVYSVEELRIRGLGRIYNQMIDYYIKAGKPEPRALNYLLSELSKDGAPIERAIFVEADIDLHHQTRSWRPKDLLMKYHSGALPAEQRYYVMGRVKVYDTASPHHPLVWASSWNHPVKTTGIYNVTASVYQDSDSIALFSQASRMMSRIMLATSPKRAYMEGTTDIDTAVAGQVLDNQAATPQPNLTEADRKTLQRLLREQ